MIYRERATGHRFEVTGPATSLFGVWLEGPYEGQEARWSSTFFAARFDATSDLLDATRTYPDGGFFE